MVTLTVVVQFLASVTVNVFNPAVKPVCDGVIVYGAVPPDGVTVALPSLPPAQVTGVVCAAIALSAAVGCVIVTLAVVVHMFASVTVNVFNPTVKPVRDGVIVYGAVPPDGVTVATPLLPPKQLTGVVCTAIALSAAVGWVIVTFTVVVQKFASVTENVFNPTVKPV
jgi:hypothetical protein